MSLFRASEQEKKKRVALAKRKSLQEDLRKKAECKTYGRAAFAGLLAIPTDHWDSDDDMPLTASSGWESDDDIPLAACAGK